MRSFIALAREAVASAVSQRATSVLAAIIVAGMCAAILLTVGRTVGAQQSVLASVDSAGTRSIIIRGENGSGLNTGALERISQLEGIAWLAGFGPVSDVANAAFSGGQRVPLRALYAANLSELELPPSRPAQTAFASSAAREQLGLHSGTGVIRESDSGIEHTVVGQFSTPDYLNFLDPLVLVPEPIPVAAQDISVLVVVAEHPNNVGPLADALMPLVAAEDFSKVKISTSEQLANLRGLIEVQLGAFSQGLVVGLTLLTTALVGAVLYGLVALRRKDFGRRRALGASRSLIIGLLLFQTAFTSIIGAAVGCLVAFGTLAVGADPQPPAHFFIAVAVLSTGAGLIAALLPAFVASRRDPLRELRVP